MQRANDKIDENNINSITSCQATVPENAEVFSGDDESFYQALLDCCLSSSNLLELVNNRMEQLHYLYKGKSWLDIVGFKCICYTCSWASMIFPVYCTLTTHIQNIHTWKHSCMHTLCEPKQIASFTFLILKMFAKVCITYNLGLSSHALWYEPQGFERWACKQSELPWNESQPRSVIVF